MKTLLSVVLLLTPLFSSAQDIVLEHPIEMTRSIKDQRTCYSFVDDQTNNLYLVLYNHKTIRVLSLTPEFSLTGEREIAKPADTRELIGHAISSTHMSLFFNNSSQKMSRVKINLASGEMVVERLENDNPKTKYLRSFSTYDKFFVISTLKNSNVIILQTYSGDQELQTTTYDFSNHKLSSDGSIIETILKRDKPEFIEKDIPNPLEIAAAKTKIFKSDSSLLLTLDNEQIGTTVITLPLSDSKPVTKFYNHGFVNCGDALVYSSNSYMHENILYQFKVCQTAMVVTITDLKTGEVLRTFTTQREEEIDFKNTEIIQEGSEMNPDTKRELSKTKQFLRKCSNSNAAISVYPQLSDLVMVVGSFKEITRGAPGGPMYTPGSQISTPMGTVSTPGQFHPVHYGYGASEFSKAVYFKTKLNKTTLDHSPGTVFDDAFKKIRKYSETHIKEKNYLAAGDITTDPLIAETLFKKQNRYYLGYYDKENKKYVLREFR